MNHEIELKLRLNTTELPLLEEALASLPLIQEPTLKLLNRYFDTPEMGLSQGGAALRIRQQNELDEHGSVASGQIIQTLKTRGVSTAGLHQRMEWDWPLTEVDLDIDLIRNSEAHTYLSTSLNLASITPLFTTDFQRRVWIYQQQDSMIEIVLDQGQVETEEHSIALLELELELKKGRPEVLFELAQIIANTCPVVMSDISKAERGYGLLAKSDSYKNIKKDWSGKIPHIELDATHSVECFTTLFAYQLSVFQRSIEHSIWDNKLAQQDRVRNQLQLLENVIRLFNGIAELPEAIKLLTMISAAKQEPLIIALTWGKLSLLCGRWLYQLATNAELLKASEQQGMTTAEKSRLSQHMTQLENNKNQLPVDTLSKGMKL